MTRDETRRLVVELTMALGDEWKCGKPDDERLWMEREITNGAMTFWLIPPESYGVPPDEIEIRVRLAGDQLLAHKADGKAAPVLAKRYSVKLKPKRIAGLIKKQLLPSIAGYLETIAERAQEIAAARVAAESISDTLMQLQEAGIAWQPPELGRPPQYRTGEWAGVKFMANVAVDGDKLVVVVRGCDAHDAAELVRILQQGDANARARMEAAKPPSEEFQAAYAEALKTEAKAGR